MYHKNVLKWMLVLPGVLLALGIVLLIVKLPAGTKGGVAGLKKRQDLATKVVLPDLLSPAGDRIAAAQKIGRLKANSPKEVAFLKFCLKATEPEVRAASVTALGELNDPINMDAVLDRLIDPDLTVRKAAILAAPRLAGERAIPWLSDMVKTDDDMAVRTTAIGALMKLAQDAAYRAVLAGLDDPVADVRLAAAEALSTVTSEVGAEAMAKALLDEDGRVRNVAASTLDRSIAAIGMYMERGTKPKASNEAKLAAVKLIGERRNVQGIRALLSLVDGPVRRESTVLMDAVRDQLVAIGPNVIEPLCRATLDGEHGPAAELAAAQALTRIGQPSVQPIVDRILKWKLFPDPEELKMWVGALGEIGDPAAVPAMNRALSQDIEGMEAVVAEARQKIETISGVKLPVSKPDANFMLETPGALARTRLRKGQPLFSVGPTEGRIPDNGIVRVAMTDAIRSPGHTKGWTLDLDLVRRDGKWETRVFGQCVFLNKRDHEGRVTRLEETKDQVVMGVEMVFFDDKYVKCAYGEYEITLKLAAVAGSQIDGTFRGHCNFQEVSGGCRASAWTHAWPEPPVPPVQPGEHPRLLFRKQDLAWVRDRVRTEFGREMVRLIRRRLANGKTLFQEPVDHIGYAGYADAAVGYGFLATVFDDPAYWERAEALIVGCTSVHPYGGEHGAPLPGHFTFYPFAVDLAMDHVSPKVRQSIMERRGWLDSMMFVDRGPAGVFSSGRSAVGVPGLSALSLLHEKGPLNLVEPVPPNVMLTLSADSAVAETESLPANPAMANQLLKNWLTVGPMSNEVAAAYLQATGGAAAIRPGAGDEAKVNNVTFVYTQLPMSAVRTLPPPLKDDGYLHMEDAGNDGVTFLYGLVKADADNALMVDSSSAHGARWSRLWVNGQQIADGNVVTFQRGLHRVLVEVRGSQARPAFSVVDDKFQKALAKRHEWLMERYEMAKLRHEKTGEMQDMPILLEMAERSLRTELWDMAANNRQGTGYWILVFMGANWTARGRMGYPDLPWVFGETAESLSWMDDYSLTASMAFAPDRVKPHLMTEFQNRRTDKKRGWDNMTILTLITALVNYPLDIETP
jgi:HEAT repeat protein